MAEFWLKAQREKTEVQIFIVEAEEYDEAVSKLNTALINDSVDDDDDINEQVTITASVPEFEISATTQNDVAEFITASFGG